MDHQLLSHKNMYRMTQIHFYRLLCRYLSWLVVSLWMYSETLSVV